MVTELIRIQTFLEQFSKVNLVKLKANSKVRLVRCHSILKN